MGNDLVYFPQCGNDCVACKVAPGVSDEGRPILRTRTSRKSSVQFCGDWEAVDFAASQPETILLVPSACGCFQQFDRLQLEYAYNDSQCLPFLLHLINSNLRIIICASVPINQSIIDYYLSLVAASTNHLLEMRSRVKVITIDNRRDDISLSRKILSQPTTVRQIRRALRQSPFRETYISMHSHTVNPVDRELAAALKIDLYTFPTESEIWSTKSGARILFRDLNLPHAPGTYEPVFEEEDLARALLNLLIQECHLATKNELLQIDYAPTRIVIKIDKGRMTTNGFGNCLCRVDRLLNACRNVNGRETMEEKVIRGFRDTRPETRMIEFVADPDETWDNYVRELKVHGAIVEIWLEGIVARPHSLGFMHSKYGQVFMTGEQINTTNLHGALLPASDDYRRMVICAGNQITNELSRRGAREHVGVDFAIVQPGNGELTAYCVGLNVRWTDTTAAAHVFRVLLEKNGLCVYDTEYGGMMFEGKSERVLFCPPPLKDERYMGLLPASVIDGLKKRSALSWDPKTCKGVVLSMLPSLSAWGRIGVFCIGENEAEAKSYFVGFQNFLNSMVHQV